MKGCACAGSGGLSHCTGDPAHERVKRRRNIGDGKNDHWTGPVYNSGSVTVSRQIASSPT
ncbi:hypothetical protein SXCC_00183 [Gluconacetobacter sp. SXCC-1]|nr:hypothetical protein SXCC_00183 [Gluconacetobacter sp. SXCC-1]